MQENLRVLVIDDSEGCRDLARVKVRDYITTLGRGDYKGCEIFEAATPEEGIEKLFEARPDLVILDINFSKSGSDRAGFDKFLIPLRGQDDDLLIICWSGEQELGIAAIAYGADYFVNKATPSDIISYIWRLKRDRRLD